MVSVPAAAGSRFKGYEDDLVQDLHSRPHTVLLRRARWRTPEGHCHVAPLPAGTRGPFGPALRRFVLAPYHDGQTSGERLARLLGDLSVEISKRQLVRLLNEGHDEGEAVLRAGLEAVPWISVDETSARHANRNGVTSGIGNDAFAWFATTFSKSRLNVLKVLRAGHADYVLNAAAFAYMAERGLSMSMMARLAVRIRRGPRTARFTFEVGRLGQAAMSA